MSMQEPDVVRKAHAFLRKEGFCSRRVKTLYTDAHHSLTAFKDLEPFQRVSIEYGDIAVYPDLVGSFEDGNELFAIEVKGSSDLIKGLGQAECYQDAVHAAFLCAPAADIGKGIQLLARRRNVGLIAVSDEVQILSEPEFRSPYYYTHETVRRQIDSAGIVTQAQTFPYNLPTHYLVWLALLAPGCWYGPEAVESVRGTYPMPKDWRAALRGAQKLRLVEISAERFRLTEIGVALKAMMPSQVSFWQDLHSTLCDKSQKVTLFSVAPSVGAALRLLLLDNPMVQMIRLGLESLPNRKGSFRDLAEVCDKFDHARAIVFFFNPQALETITDERGQVIWRAVEGQHFRSTMFYQFKSVLRHAGVLAPVALGGCSAKSYNPERDLWVLQSS